METSACASTEQPPQPPRGRWRRCVDWYLHRVSPEEPSRHELISYGVGGTGTGLGEITLGMFQTQILVANLGADPRVLGVISGIKMFWDGINDTLFGHVTDNWRSRWGRRRPFIAVGGLLYGLLLMGYFWFDPTWSMKQLLIWYTVALFLVEGAGTIIGVPYAALGIELSPSYDGRTRVVAYRAFLQRLTNYAGPWFKPLAFLAAFGGILNGARVICAVVGVFVIVTSLYSAIACRERIHIPTGQPREPFLKAIRATANNRHFWRLVIIAVMIGMTTVLFNQFMFYLSLGYVFRGDQVREAKFTAVQSTLATTIALVGLPVTASISRHFGKHRALAVMILAMITSNLLRLVLIVPDQPYLMLIGPFFSTFGASGAGVLLMAMQADVVDVDELQNGQRREGLFSGVQSTLTKVSVSLAMAMTGFLIALTGYQAHLKLDQSPETFRTMLYLSSFAPVVCLLPVLALLWRYPLTHARMDEIRTELQRRRAAADSNEKSP